MTARSRFGDSPLERAYVKRMKFHEGGFAVCMLLGMLAGAASGTISPAFAQPIPMPTATVPGTTTGQSGSLGEAAANALKGGVPTDQITNAISSAGGPGMQINPSQITSILNGLQGGNASPSAIAGIVNGLVGNKMPAGIAQALSSVQNLGNITSPQQLASVLSSPAMTQALSSIAGTGGLQQAAQAAQSALGIAMNPSTALSQAGAQAITSALSNVVSPELAGAIGNTIGSLIGGSGSDILAGGPLGDVLGAAGGGGAPTGKQEPMSSQNPIDTTHTPAGCFCTNCDIQIPLHYGEVRSHTQSEFQKHRSWLVNTFWLENMLPALQLMAEQLTAVGISQVQMIGAMLDAKQQLETQRLFQQLMAQAHKDYQPSEGMCTFGTTVRSLAASERMSNVAQVAFAQRMTQRQSLSGDVTSVEGMSTDKRGRLKQFLETYCDQADNAGGLKYLCKTAVPDPTRRNIDVDYTRNIESRLTLDVDFVPKTDSGLTPDERDVFALSANLFAHNIAPFIMPERLAATDGRIRMNAAEKYMDLRAVFAKRSVAQNSFAAITSQRAAGDDSSAPYTKAILKELGIQKPEEIEKILGEKPSYFAQMEVLTKKIYQNPIFYTELYDKPVNVERKAAAMQAIGLMQDRDLYNSLLRSEVVLSVLLETMLQKEQDKVANEGPKRSPTGGGR